MGGNQPVSSAVIQMYTPENSGYGSSSTPLLNRLVTTGSSSVSEFLSTGRPQSGATGYGAAALANPFRLALDRSCGWPTWARLWRGWG